MQCPSVARQSPADTEAVRRRAGALGRKEGDA